MRLVVLKLEWTDTMQEWTQLKTKLIRLIFLFCLILVYSCYSKTPLLIYQPIPRQYQKLKSPNELYSKDFVGPFDCKKENFKCISNNDLKEELKIKAEYIESVRFFIESIEEQNQIYLDFLSKPCDTFDFKCKKDRKKTK